ncbi:MAG: hypothetical protein NTZ78_02060 [Candidatus Aureabacteria bacterium]|nr:hypothetical protein [Candidatus Auribacterota bacterium]
MGEGEGGKIQDSMERARGGICAMAESAEEMFRLAGDGFARFRMESLQAAKGRGNAMGSEAVRLTAALVEGHEKGAGEESRALRASIGVIHQIKLIGDSIIDFCDTVLVQMREGLLLSDAAFEEIITLHGKVVSIMQESIRCIREDKGDPAQSIGQKGLEVQRLLDNSRAEHEKRLISGACEVRSSVLFMDMIEALNRITGHVVRIAKAWPAIGA